MLTKVRLSLLCHEPGKLRNALADRLANFLRLGVLGKLEEMLGDSLQLFGGCVFEERSESG